MEVLTPLVKPRTYYDRFPPSLFEAFVVVSLVALIVTGSLLSIGWLATGRMGTNIALDSPAHPSDAICEQSGDRVSSASVIGCGIPQTSAQRATDWRSVGGWIPVTFTGVFVVWGALALGVHGLAKLSHSDGELVDSFAVAGWATAPLAVEAIVTLLLVFLVFARLPPELPLDGARRFVAAYGGPIRFLIAGAAAAWQAYIIALGLTGIRDADLSTTIAVGGTASLVLFLLAGI